MNLMVYEHGGDAYTGTDAPHTGADVRIEPYDWPDLVAATRPVGAQG